MFERQKITMPWDGRIEPFRLVGNVYFVGTYQASSHLIDTGDGLILIDTGYENTLYLLIDSIYKLGYRPEQIKYIVNTHWHHDHTAGSAALANLSGAKNLIGHKDFEKAKKYVVADELIKEGDTLSLGNCKIEFWETPGHTAGTLSLFFDVVEDGKTLRAGMFGGAGLNTLKQGRFDFEGAREAYFASLRRLSEAHVDVLIGNHSWNNDTWNKARILAETGENTFVDPTLWNKFLTYYEKKLKRIIRKEAEEAAAAEAK